MTTANYAIAENITQFLIQTNGSALKDWRGKMSKKDQLKLFGHYFGKGTIYIDATAEDVTHTIKVCFGTDYDHTACMKWDGTFLYNNRGV